MACSALPQLLSLLLLLPFLFFPSSYAISKSDCNIGLNSSLFARDDLQPWLSPSGEFAFGFQRLKSTDAKLFLLAIWFNKIPDETIVWSANHAPAPEGSELMLTKDGDLKLNNPEEKEIWRPEQTGNTRATCAGMLDSGNFVLANGDSDSNHTWESFKHPTDTILPGQILGMGSRLSSGQSETNYTNGQFQLRMQTDGNLVLYSVSMPTEVIYGPYWASGTRRPNPESRLIFNEAGYIYVQDGNQNVFHFSTKGTGSKQDVYRMARIDNDGVFRQYDHPKMNYPTSNVGSCKSSWSVVQSIPEDICLAIIGSMGSGACGYNSYCVTENGKPSCLCPEGYSYVHPLDKRKGCKPDFPLPSCRKDGWETNIDLIEFKELNATDWPLTDYDLQSGSEVDKETCKQYCREDCFCAVAIYNGTNCWKKRFPLSNGRKSASVDRIALIKVPREDATDQCPNKKDQSTLILVGSIILGSSVFLNFLLLLAISAAIFFWYHKKLLSLQSVSNTFGMNVRSYTYKELEEATGGFKQQLGKGAFGTVYKGVLASDPKRFVAVKKLDKVVQEGEKEFKTEVNVIGQTHHKNLVRLLGYCDEGEHRLLVYEYMSNGSLARLLFGISKPDWNQRVQIAFGIARGLMYLHEECSTQIIHCDIKPQNILLDENFTPRIADFGLAKLLLAEQTRAARTGVRGTIGYFAPEWFRKVSITVKVDVYSFGAMLLEIICCKSSVEFAMRDEEEALIDWAYDCYCKRKLDKLVENDEEARNDMKRLHRLVMVAIWCIQEDPSLRPSMRKVTQMLEGVVEVSVPPRPSAYSSS